MPVGVEAPVLEKHLNGHKPEGISGTSRPEKLNGADFSQRRRQLATYAFELPQEQLDIEGNESVILRRFLDAQETGLSLVKVTQVEGPKVKIQMDTQKRDVSVEVSPEGANFLAITRVSGEPVSLGNFYWIREQVASEIQVGGMIFGKSAHENLPLRDRFKHLTSTLTDDEADLVLPYIPKAMETFESPNRFVPRAKRDHFAVSRKGHLFTKTTKWDVTEPIRLNVSPEDPLLNALKDAEEGQNEQQEETSLRLISQQIGRLLGPEIAQGRFPSDHSRMRHRKPHPTSPKFSSDGKFRYVKDCAKGCRREYTNGVENALTVFRGNSSMFRTDEGEFDVGKLAQVLASSKVLARAPNYFVRPAVERGLIPAEKEYRIYERVSQLAEEEMTSEERHDKKAKRAEALLWANIDVRHIPKTRQNAHVALDIRPRPTFR